ncbi:MAG TPA: glucokinase [Caulobacteraceae bacterium]|nr:glucokinase [Caulobacteraceae bacterium]
MSGQEGLVGDVGGTHARFALARLEAGRVHVTHAKVLSAHDYRSGEAALAAYCGHLPDRAPKQAVIAAAGPIENARVDFTNNPGWGFSEAELKRGGGFSAARLINDFTAQALAIPQLGSNDTRLVGPRRRTPAHATAVIMGPGTGFGAAALADDGRATAVVTGEGGHASFAPEDDTEIAILARLAKAYGRVSIEHLLSGPGLLNLYRTLAELGGEAAPLDQPDAITRAGLAGDRLARRALDRFCAILGSVAGNLALTLGARGGVYVSGGIAPAILEVLKASDFRRRFEAKDRMSAYLAAIPTRVVVQPHVALIGAATLLGTLR